MKVRWVWLWMLLVVWKCSEASLLALLPFPLSAGQRGMVTCLDNPSISYDVYLPTTYGTNMIPLPVLYTFNPNGGGMVTHFQAVSTSLKIITIGVVSPKNNESWDVILRDCNAVARDVRNRLLYDPTAEMVAGFSGGGVVSYAASRFRPQNTAGVYAMSGWLGRIGAVYPAVDRVQTNLLVARSIGTLETGAALYYLPLDSNYLASCGAVIKDWTFSGGHQSAPDSQKTEALTWILNSRYRGTASDRANSITLAANWQTRLAAGEQQAVLREAVDRLMNQPRSWFAYQAQFIIDQLTNGETFRTLDVAQLATGDFASNEFYFRARGAGLNADWPRYYSCMKALTGIVGVTGDRTGGIYSMLTSYGYRAPVLQCATVADQINLSIVKDTPGLNYFAQVRSNLLDAAWQDLPVADVNTNTAWAASVPMGAAEVFYRIRTGPTPTSTPEWP